MNTIRNVMRTISAKEAREIKIPDDIKNKHKMSDDEIKREIFDIEKALDWPLWPILPIKNVYWRDINRGLPWSASMIAAGKDGKNLDKRVYLINMFDMKDRGMKNIHDVVTKVEYIEYNSWQDMFDAGWRVD